MDKIFFTNAIPPILPVAYDDGLTYLEAVGKLTDKINEIITLVNDLHLTEVVAELEQLKADVIKTKTEMETYVINSINEQNKEINLLVQGSLSSINNSVDTKLEQFKEEISSLSNVFVVDPTTGNTVGIQIALDNMYSELRQNGITASKYDSKNLTASAYDSKNITAKNFDINGAVLLQ